MSSYLSTLPSFFSSEFISSPSHDISPHISFLITPSPSSLLSCKFAALSWPFFHVKLTVTSGYTCNVISEYLYSHHFLPPVCLSSLLPVPVACVLTPPGPHRYPHVCELYLCLCSFIHGCTLWQLHAAYSRPGCTTL